MFNEEIVKNAMEIKKAVQTTINSYPELNEKYSMNVLENAVVAVIQELVSKIVLIDDPDVKINEFANILNKVIYNIEYEDSQKNKHSSLRSCIENAAISGISAIYTIN